MPDVDGKPTLEESNAKRLERLENRLNRLEDIVVRGIDGVMSMLEAGLGVVRPARPKNRTLPASTAKLPAPKPAPAPPPKPAYVVPPNAGDAWEPPD